ncbi:PAS domain S-box protein [Pseudomonas sp. App30]|uniref:hybrid sensor histidine kinase/response regulator n=1 Tax=Pseudomonas sp. App30 TaxID=3068990 RepID=UPI003A8065A3
MTLELVQPSYVAEDRFRLLIDSITDYAIYMLNLDGEIISWNAGARRFKGYDEQEILGQHFSRFYTDEDRAAGKPGLALACAAQQGRFESEGWRVRKDGSQFWCHVIIDPVRTPDGSVIGFAKVTRDLTQQRQAQEALRQSQEQFRLLVLGVTDYAIYMLDPDGIITNWNAGAERIKGYRPDEVIGRHFSMFFEEAARNAGEPQRSLATALAEGRFENRAWRVRKDGTRFFANIVIDAIRDDSGTLLGFAKITRDITESVETQRALDEAREALFQSQKMEALGQLTGGIAHDFNNLLMVILSSLEIVRRRLPPDPRITPLLNNAVQGAQRGASLTRRMLAFARRQQLVLEAVDLGVMVRGMADLLQSSLGSRIQIETRFPLFVRPVRADGNQLELAVLNLAVNARDAMPDGGVLVIEARECQLTEPREGVAAGNYVCLSLTDTGEGMDPLTLARATEPFFTTKGVGKGTGLGLSMVDGVAAQVGGKLVVRSARPGGTTAELWLPVDEGAPVTAPVASASSQVSTAKGLSVLLVDDDPLILVSAEAMLEDLGCRVHTAASGEQALALLEQGSDGFDLLITDHMMPHMSGPQLAARALTLCPGLQVLIVSGFGEVDSAATAFARLAKPFDQQSLARALAGLQLV